MSKPKQIYWEYRIAAPKKDIFLSPKDLSLSLEGDPYRTSYQTYFETIKYFIAQNLKHLFPDIDIGKIIIRAEKHGAFYHPASIECFSNKGNCKFLVNVATHPEAAKCLQKEFKLVCFLNKKFTLPYLPKFYLAGQIGKFYCVLGEWFEGFHEFHLTKDSQGQKQIILWDFDNGYRYLNLKEAETLFEQIAMVLGLYYDLESFAQIYPWHHAAGDFIVKSTNSSVEVRLTTVRGYDPLIGFFQQEEVNPIFALIYFFLNLTLRTRLDRIDGTKGIDLVEEFCLKPTLKGFLKAIKLKENELQSTCGLGFKELIELLKAFNVTELKALFNRILPLYQKKEGFGLIKSALNGHIHSLYQAIQDYPE